jgi:hypothetical protein
MIELTREQTLQRVGVFGDSEVIAMELAAIADDMEHGEESRYWLKEAEIHIIGMHKLVLDLYKLLKQEEAEKYYAIHEDAPSV